MTWIDGRPEGTIPGTWSMTKNGAPSTAGSRSTHRARGTGTDGYRARPRITVNSRPASGRRKIPS